MKEKRNVYVTRLLHPPVMERLKEICNYEVNPEDRPLSREELLRNVKGRDAVLCFLHDQIDAEVLEAAGPQCKIFANGAVGYNNIDLAEAEKRGIWVSNTPDVLTDATADLAWALLFDAARRVSEGDRLVRKGEEFEWAPNFMLGVDITGRTLGVLGAGRIGSNFARKSQGFGMKVLYSNRRPSPSFEAETGARYVDRETLLRESDFISIHVPLTPETHHMIGPKELAMMKETAVLINTSRGPVINEKALAHALKTGQIRAAGLDVYENEPEVEPELLSLDNVVMTPHIGSATLDTRINIGLLAVRNIEAALNGETPPNLVVK
ncbi:MAG: D-glycerate dehydrogenase [Fretibacterium sp.]|nr:D-glycerate dehydrogenase [Fretibacterium sp.]